MEKILYFDYIEEKLKYSFLSQNIIIISKRNNLIYLTFFQIFSSLFGMFYFIFRRTIIYIYKLYNIIISTKWNLWKYYNKFNIFINSLYINIVIWMWFFYLYNN